MNAAPIETPEETQDKYPGLQVDASYSPDDNKIRLRCSKRLPRELYDRVRAAGYIWAPKQDLFVAPMWTPERADLALDLAGEIDDEDTSLVDRAEERAERFEEYQSKRAADASQAHAAVERIAGGIPLGQPILVGHHSERRARKDAERIRNGMTRAVKLWETSQYWERRAKGAIYHARYKELPGVRQRRIKGLEADRRREIKSRDASETFAKLWSKPELTREMAVKIANYDRVLQYGTWSKLSDSEMTSEEARAIALEAHATTIARCNRWIMHIDLRLTYERAMLGDTPTPVKIKRAQPPIANYPGEGFHPMTKAEYVRLHKDYRCTRVVRGMRVRSAIVRGALVGIFLTDSKRIDPPAEGSDVVPRFRDNHEPEMRSTRAHTPPAATPFDAMRASLKAGIKIVSADQLFPTPVTLCERMVRMSGIEHGHRVLEPSAGTGNIVKAIRTFTRELGAGLGVNVVAIEIQVDLVTLLREYGVARAVSVIRGDFLELLRADVGDFDRIIMNPPFKDAADVAHILHARSLLRPGGKIVAICAAGSRQEAALKPLADTWETLPSGTFDGTNVRAVLLTMVESADLDVSLPLLGKEAEHADEA